MSGGSMGASTAPEPRDPGHPPGRDGSRSRHGGRVWVASGGPGRGPGRRAAGERRAPPRGRPPQGHGDEQVDDHAREAGHRPRRVGRRAPRPRPRRQRARRPDARPELARPADLGPDPGRRVLRGRPFGNTVDDQRVLVRQAILNQLTFDPNTGTSTSLSADGAVLIAFGRGDIVGARLAGADAASIGQHPVLRPVADRDPGPGDVLGRPDAGHDGRERRPDVRQGWRSADDLLPGRRRSPRRTVRRSSRARSGRRSSSSRSTRRRSGPRGPRSRRLGAGPGACLTRRRGCAAVQHDGTPLVELFDRQAGAWMRLAHFADRRTRSRTRRATSTRPRAQVLVRFVTSDQKASGSRSRSSSRGRSSDGDRVARGLAKRYDRHARGGRSRPRHRGRGDLRAGRPERRRQDDHAAHAGHAAHADERRRRDRRASVRGTPTRSAG